MAQEPLQKGKARVGVENSRKHRKGGGRGQRGRVRQRVAGWGVVRNKPKNPIEREGNGLGFGGVRPGGVEPDRVEREPRLRLVREGLVPFVDVAEQF